MILRLVGKDYTGEHWFPSDAPRSWGVGVRRYDGVHDRTRVEMIEENYFLDAIFKLFGPTYPKIDDRCKCLVYTIEFDTFGFIWDDGKYDAYLMNDDGKTYQRLS